MTRDEIVAAALELSVDDRAALAMELLEATGFDDDVEAAWAEEITRRVAEIDEGRVQMIPVEQVFEGLRRQSRELRSRRAG